MTSANDDDARIYPLIENPVADYYHHGQMAGAAVVAHVGQRPARHAVDEISDMIEAVVGGCLRSVTKHVAGARAERTDIIMGIAEQLVGIASAIADTSRHLGTPAEQAAMTEIDDIAEQAQGAIAAVQSTLSAARS